MPAVDLESRFAELKARCANLSAEQQERAVLGCTEVVTLCELPAEPGETLSLVVTLDRSSDITHLSG